MAGCVPIFGDMDDMESSTSGSLETLLFLFSYADVGNPEIKSLDKRIGSKNHAGIHRAKFSKDLCEALI